MTPGRISGRSAASARSATAQAAAIRSTSAGSLVARSASTQPSTGTSSTSGRGGREPLPDGVRHEAGLDRDPPRPDRRHELRPARRQVVVRLEQPRLRRLAPGLDRVARVGEDDDVRPPADQELAGVAGDLLLALGEREPGQVAHVLAPDPEVGVDAGLREPGPEPRQPSRPGGPIRLVPAGAICGCGRRREVRRHGPAASAGRLTHFFRYFLMFAWCSLNVFAKAVVPLPSPLARKYR